MEAVSSEETTGRQPHLVSLVLQSKKALQHGEQLCSQAQSLSNASARVAVDVLTLDAKVRWISDSVLEQLKLVASVAKIIEEKRTKLKKQVQEWEEIRIKRCDELEVILDDLGSQRVPPEFHQTSVESSLFGSHSDDEEPNGHVVLSTSPSDTVLPTFPAKRKAHDDRRNWKTLRDFVDDQAIEEIFEKMESERTALEDTMSKTDEYPESLNNTLTTIRSSLPELGPSPSIEQLFHNQDSVTVPMARHLESLASHYDQMASALRDSEAGDVFSDEDVQQMNRDTDELPSIMAELEECLSAVNNVHQSLSSTRSINEGHIRQLSVTLDDLDELGEIMGEMLTEQEAIESQCEQRLTEFQVHLSTIEHLHERYVAYRLAFRKLVLEISRRRRYKEAAENIVQGMMSQLESMSEEERLIREHFNNDYGAHLPEDLCLSIGNWPTKWTVIPCQGDKVETLPEIPPDLVAEAGGASPLVEAESIT
ncbi:hypothetical protein E1B28_011229 [Marasmius oreades]|uniref:Autophagy-related protein 17 n=1 Tax=Marasmius oreades TaxID=181124 RepID=A0A9P7RU59_9AGAR|nr:uncharacterized protein E1B28_011229 [Marasmius oreades]KAG7089557.1 hypothetical protein E1B28_011229 [Marasmius oreades]